MYSSDQFLKYAESYLSADEVTDETVEQVRGYADMRDMDLDFCENELLCGDSRSKVKWSPDDMYTKVFSSERDDYEYPRNMLAEEYYSIKNGLNLRSFPKSRMITKMVKEWLSKDKYYVKINFSDGIPEIFAYTSDYIDGVEVCAVESIRDIFNLERIAMKLEKGLSRVKKGIFQNYILY